MIILAALVVALAVSVGTALTLERRATGSAVAIQTAVMPVGTSSLCGRLPEAVSLVLTGCVLIALAAAVRRVS
jgi:ABC-type nickel/cobalt efflux system permease component RcnA